MRPHGSVMKLEIFLPNFGHTIPFVELLGFVLVRMEQGRSELHYEAQAVHLNTFGVTHGGASMTLMDVAMAVATRSLQPDMGCVTIEMKSSFMQPARGPLVARGEVLAEGDYATVSQNPRVIEAYLGHGHAGQRQRNDLPGVADGVAASASSETHHG